MGWWIYENKLKSSLIKEKEGRIVLAFDLIPKDKTIN